MQLKDKYNVAVAGATGAVGQEMVRILEERNFPVKDIRLLASERSEGKSLKFHGKDVKVEKLTRDVFGGIDIALYSAGASRSKEFAPFAVNSGTVVIDNSSAFRMDKDVPLIVPEVNPHHIVKHSGIIANPNCSTIQLVVALKPLHDVARIKRIVATTFQSVSGAGSKPMWQLWDETENALKKFKFQDIKCAVPKREEYVLPYQIAFNLIPHIDIFLENGYTKEEMKLVNETRKIMDDDSINITATCVRVPVLRAHSESVNIETKKAITPDEARKILSTAPGVELVDDINNLKYPMPLDAGGKDAVYVGRIRRDESIPNGLNLWVVSDNLRKGAALNAIQIAELIIKK